MITKLRSSSRYGPVSSLSVNDGAVTYQDAKIWVRVPQQVFPG